MKGLRKAVEIPRTTVPGAEHVVFRMCSRSASHLMTAMILCPPAQFAVYCAFSDSVDVAAEFPWFAATHSVWFEYIQGDRLLKNWG